MQEVIVKSDYELERGKPMPSKNHGFIQGKLTFLLMLHFSEKYEIASEINVLINGRVKVPDLAIFDNVNYTPGYDEINVEEIPVGVIEILSPKQSMTDLIAKPYEYFGAGAKSGYPFNVGQNGVGALHLNKTTSNLFATNPRGLGTGSVGALHLFVQISRCSTPTLPVPVYPEISGKPRGFVIKFL
jgi:Uma2 family endonuclease